MTSGGVREQKKQRTRDLLEQRAMELFARKGFAATTIDEIAEAALVSPRTFFRYYASKEDVVFGTNPQELAFMRQLVANRPESEGPGAALRGAFMDMSHVPPEQEADRLMRLQLISANPPLLARRLLLQREWEEGLAEELALRERVEGPTLELRVLAATGMAALATALFVWAERNGREPVGDLIHEVLAVDLSTAP